MEHIRIRRTAEEDWQRVREIRLRSLADSPDAFASRLSEEEKRPPDEWRVRLSDHSNAFFLAETESSSCVGIAFGAAWIGEPQTAGLFGMWVAPAFRKQGLGVALVNTVTDWAKAEGFARLLLHVAQENVAARTLYRLCRFEATGKIGTLRLRENTFMRSKCRKCCNNRPINVGG